MKKNIIFGIIGFILGVSVVFTVPVVAKVAKKVFKNKVVFQNGINVKKNIKNSKGPVYIKDKLKVKKVAKFIKNINVQGQIKNNKDNNPVKVNDNFRVTGNATILGNLQTTNLDLTATDTSGIDTSAYTGGEIRYNSNDNKLYLFNRTEWIDLGVEQGDIAEVGTIASGTWQGGEISDDYISDNITASNYLPLAGGTMTGDTTIEKTNPSFIFKGSDDIDFWMGMGDELVLGSPYEAFFQIGEGSTPNSDPILSITNGGSVGIGTGLPTATLDVDGDTGYGVIEVNGDSGGCIQIQDSDNDGLTSITTLNGVLTIEAHGC
ncbi:MAG: hypothetical protein ABID45_03055 [Patescibacteria group bacterium]